MPGLSTLVVYNSNDRISGTPGRASYRINTLRHKISDAVVYLHPIYITIPNVFYNIHTGNNVVNYTENGTPVQITVPVGNYTGLTLQATIESLLNANTTTAEVYTVVYDFTGTFKYTITATLNSTVLQFTSTSTDPYVYDEIFHRMGFTLTQSGTTLISQNIVNLLRTKNIAVQLSIHSGSTTSRELPITTAFPLDVSFGELKTHQFQLSEAMPVHNIDMGVVTIILYDEFGRFLEFDTSHSVISVFRITNEQ